MSLTLNECGGELCLGPFRFAWRNQDQDFDGFTILSYNDYNLEFGSIDQDQQGIYLTRYVDGEVLQVRTLFLLPNDTSE